MGKAEQASKEKENLKKVTDKKETKKEIKSIWYELGFNAAGPVYKGLFEWIEKEALIPGKKVFFAAGTGYNLYKLCEEKGYSNAVYTDISKGALYLNEIGAFAQDAVFFDCSPDGRSQKAVAEAKKLAHVGSRELFYYPWILDTKEAISNLKGRHYKTFFFDFWNNYELQGTIKQGLKVCGLFFTNPERFEHADEVLDGIRDYISKKTQEESDSKDTASKEASQDAAAPAEADSPDRYTLTEGLRRLIVFPTDEEARTIGDIERIAFITDEEFEKDHDTPIPWKRGLLTRSDIPHDLKKKIAEYYDIAIPGEASQKDLHLEIGESIRNYDRWIRNREKDSISSRRAEEKITFSVVVPVYNVKISQLKDCIESVLAQTYRKFELILVEDCSTQKDVVPALKEYEGREEVKLIFRTSNGNISVATNDGINAAKGDYIVFMDCDDVMDVNALNEFALKLEETPELDFIYTDEDKITEEDKIRHMAYFKPDWSPDLYLCMNYTNHLSAYRASLAKQTGGLRSEYNGSQDYDFVLRFLELTDNKRIGHIPKILYHWRERRESVAYETGSKSYAIIAAKKAKEEALRRRGIKASLEFIQENDQYRIVYDTVGDPKVSIVIPSKDHLDILKSCIDSICEFTAYKNYEIIVVDNGSSKSNYTDISLYLADKGARYIYGEYPFNFSLMCNKGAEEAKGDYILFLNDDIEIFSPQWLERMLGQAMQPGTGAVGAKLYYPGTTIIQHGGVINRENGPGHLLFREEDAIGHYFGCNRVDTDCIAVTGACLMISKEKFRQAGGFNEDLPIAYNDVELCYKLLRLGYYNVFRNDAVAFHHESLSRGTDQEDEEKLLRLGREYASLIKEFPEYDNEDPFLNPNLATYGAEMELRNRYEKLSCVDLTGAEAAGLADVDEVTVTHHILIRGWSFLQGRDDNAELERYLILEDPFGRVLKCQMCRWDRGDVKSNYPNESGALMSGFVCLLKKEDLRMDVIPYHIGVLTVDKDGKKLVAWTGKKIPAMREPFPKKQYGRQVNLDEIKNAAGKTENAAANTSESGGNAPKMTEVLWGLDDISSDEYTICIEGYAFMDTPYHYDYDTYIEIGGKAFTVQRMERADVAAFYPEKHYLYYTGFRCVIRKDAPDAGKKAEPVIVLVNRNDKSDITRIKTGRTIDI